MGKVIKACQSDALPGAQKDGLAETEGVEVHVLGDLTLPPPAVQGAAARMMRATAGLQRKRAVLNICFAYTCAPHQHVTDCSRECGRQHQHQSSVHEGPAAP
jgi:undecaprenyl pyrophosphate synthase